jgi:putative Holliday junction resolvase
MPGPVLGLDFGERRIGVAISDGDRLVATGLATLDLRKHPDPFKPLETFIAERRVAEIVVGYPLRTDGAEGPGAKTEAVDVFVAELKARFGLPVHLEDEAFTSSMAEDSLRARRKRGDRPRDARGFARQKAEVDRVAACFILQDWLDHEDGARAADRKAGA